MIEINEGIFITEDEIDRSQDEYEENKGPGSSSGDNGQIC